jgi:hypothetical protein
MILNSTIGRDLPSPIPRFETLEPTHQKSKLFNIHKHGKYGLADFGFEGLLKSSYVQIRCAYAL